MKKILVTGATGFVGSHMVDFLLDNIKNIKIYATKRYHLSRIDKIQHFYDKINWVDCDLTDPVSVNKIIKQIKPDKILHFAAESFVSPSWDHPNRYMSVNYNATVNLLEALRQSKSNCKFLIPGSGEEYGEVDKKDIPVNTPKKKTLCTKNKTI